MLADSGDLVGIHVNHGALEYGRSDGFPRAIDYIRAARVPSKLEPQEFGLWTIKRVRYQQISEALKCGFPTQTILYRTTLATMMNTPHGELVMEDSMIELRKHLPIWMNARGRVLITGLGLGCVVRGLLINPRVTSIDVVELDKQILRVIGAEFKNEPRVKLHLGDALQYEWPADARWEFAWHDLWVPEDPDERGVRREALQVLHAELFERFYDRCDRQGAWDFPREVRRRVRKTKPEKFL